MKAKFDDQMNGRFSYDGPDDDEDPERPQQRDEPERQEEDEGPWTD